MNTLITYDISDKHSEVKEGLLALGFNDFGISDAGLKCYLPNTTMVILAKNYNYILAKEELIKICKRLDVKLIRCFAFNFTEWTALQDEPYDI